MTLVIAGPSRDGLVIVSDSRTSVGAQFCDGRQKLHPIGDRQILTVTGHGEFVAPPTAAEAADICRYIATAPPLISINALVREELTRGNATWPEIGDLCVRAIRDHRTARAGSLDLFLGRDLCRSVLFSFDPDSRISRAEGIVLSLTASGEESVTVTEPIIVGPGDAWWPLAFGETGYLESIVYSGPGRVFLAPETIGLVRDKRPVRDIGVGESLAAAINILGAASQIASVIPPPSGIGGPIQGVVLVPEVRWMEGLRPQVGA